MGKIDTGKTMEIVKKFWILILGFLIVFSAILYFIRVGYDEGWIPPLAIVFLGGIAGSAGFIVSFIFFKKEYKIIGEIIAGFSCGIIYATIAYSSFAGIWVDAVTLIIIIIITIVLSMITFVFNLRILTTLGFAAALFAPFIVKAPDFQFFILFIYGFTINAAILFFTVMKKWKELPVIGLVITTILYIAYSLIIFPLTWIEPVIYISLVFLLYMAGLFIMAKREGDSLSVLSLSLISGNVLLYIIWMCLIFSEWGLKIAIAFMIFGFISLIIAVLIFILFKIAKQVTIVYFFLGLVLVAVSGIILSGSIRVVGMEHVVRGALWVVLTAVLFFTGYKLKKDIIAGIGVISWFLVFLYWFINAWGIEHVKWFGIEYIPFINPPGLLWSAVAGLGFFISVFSKKLVQNSTKIKNKRNFLYGIVAIALLSHLAVGGLLTLQILYLWNFYKIDYDVNIIYSICWGVYAFILFLWGYLNKERFFIYFADLILIVVSVKVLFFDMAGQTNIFKAVTILLTGIMIIVIGFLNYKRETSLAFNAKSRKE